VLDDVEEDRCLDEELLQEQRRRGRRECPIPKPGGIVGEVLGFKSENDSNDSTHKALVERKERERNMRPP